jgi:hypothetical protein
MGFRLSQLAGFFGYGEGLNWQVAGTSVGCHSVLLHGTREIVNSVKLYSVTGLQCA